MNTKLSILLLVAIVNVGLGLFVYFRNPKYLVNKLFTWFVLCIAIWTLCVYMIRDVTAYISNVRFGERTVLADTSLMTLILGRIVAADASLIALVFFYFSTAFPDRKSLPIGKQFWLFTCCGLIMVLIAPSSLILEGVKLADYSTQVNLEYEAIRGPAYPIFAIYILSCFGYGLMGLGMKWHRSLGIHRLQIQYLFLGVFLFAICGVTTNLLIPLFFHTVRYGVYGPFFSIFLIALTAHAIVRYRLMDIHLVLKKGLVYLLSIAAVAGICMALVFEFKKIERIPLSSIVIILILAVGFEHIRRGVEFLINRYFYRTTSNYQKTLRQASRVLTTVLDLQQLFDYLTDLILQTMMVDSISILLYDESKGAFETRLRRTYLVGEKELNIALTDRSTLIERIQKLDGPIIRDEIEKRFPPYLAERLLAEMSDLDAEVVFGMLSKGDLIGLIGIGRKLSGDAYFTEDLEILNLIADETAIAVRNAQLYQQVASLELERNRAQQLALIGTLAATLTHELKNHLVPIRTFVEVLPEFSDPEFQNFSRIAIEGIDHMTNRISEFQNLADSTPPKLSPVDPIAALEATLLLMSAKLQQVKVVQTHAPDLPRVKVDASQLKQVFLNLLLNSSEAMEGPGEIRLETFVVPGVFIHQGEPFAPHSPPPVGAKDERDGALFENMVGISISDTGCGIPDEDLQKIFEPFFTTKEHGTGLGLPTCKRIIESFNGKIVPNNKGGKGVTMTVYLPILTND
ncbi:hypothetical protein HYR99_16965 [Candidatus Poribacteria bacterium]|nr:hypothetical protein [Candidatus Poribacteria bacterium]